MANPFRRVELYSTYQFTWTGSAAPDSLAFTIRTASETVIASANPVSSGTQNWYTFVTMTTTFIHYPVTLVAQWTATQSTQAGCASPFISRMVFELDYTQAFDQGRRQ